MPGLVPPWLRAWLLVRVLRGGGAPGRQALAALTACLLAALGAWLILGPALQDELDAALERRQKLQAQLDALRGQLAAPAETAEVPLAGAVSQAAPWRWQQMASAAGLQLEHLQAAAAGGPDATVQLRLRGNFHQHGAWVAIWAGELAAPSLRSYQLQASEGGLLVADVQLQPGAGHAGGQAGSASVRSFRPAAPLDPFGAPPPTDPLATLPASWRAQWQRPPRWLEAAPLQDLEFTGTLRRGQHWVALLRWEHMLHTVRAGDSVGLQRSQVQRIDEHGLWLREIVAGEGGHWQERERHWRVGERP